MVDPTAKSLKLLIIEDEDIWCKEIRLYARLLGHDTTVARSYA
jgi:hypothetical protein